MNIERTQRMSKQLIPDIFDDRFRWMVLRRGYTFDTYKDDEGCYARISAGGRQIIDKWTVDYQTLLELERFLDQVVGQHHMQCGQCGEPVLVKYDVEVKDILSYWRFPEASTLVPTPHVSMTCCAVAAGPTSEPIEKCPGCGLLLSECVREIDDAEMST